MSNINLFENDLQIRKDYKIISGTDEAGRGPLAGPVVCASVILPEDFYHQYLDDSKKLNEKKRNELFNIIKEKAISYSIEVVDHQLIDQMNILNATLFGMKKSLDSLNIIPDLALIDGNKVPQSEKIKCQYVIGGDHKHACIAAASILAKVFRDQIMYKYHIQYPEYGFDKHKGYPTSAHFKAIRTFGICDIHRKTYKPVMQMTIEDLV